MITRYKNFSVFKAKPNENPKLPTHALSMKIGEEYVNVGGAWTKDSTNGKFLSAKLADAWVGTDKGKAREGFCIVRESELDLLEGEKIERTIDPMDGRDLTPSAEMGGSKTKYSKVIGDETEFDISFDIGF